MSECSIACATGGARKLLEHEKDLIAGIGQFCLTGNVTSYSNAGNAARKLDWITAVRCQPRHRWCAHSIQGRYRSILNSQHQTGSISAFSKRNPHLKRNKRDRNQTKRSKISAPESYPYAHRVRLQVRLSQSPSGGHRSISSHTTDGQCGAIIRQPFDDLAPDDRNRARLHSAHMGMRSYSSVQAGPVSYCDYCLVVTTVLCGTNSIRFRSRRASRDHRRDLRETCRDDCRPRPEFRWRDWRPLTTHGIPFEGG